MALERGRQLEIAVSVVTVLAFVAVILLIGVVFGGSGLSEIGGYALVAAIGVFVLSMAGGGIWLARTLKAE